MSWELTSPAFAPNGKIPRAHTCDAEDASPALNWSAPPEGTESLALIMDDPDAPVGTWVHWVLYNLPATARELDRKVRPDEILPNSARQGRNDFGRIGYGGPCPPPGPEHRYFFKLYAVDKTLDLAPGARKQELLRALDTHILGQVELVGRYQR